MQGETILTKTRENASRNIKPVCVKMRWATTGGVLARWKGEWMFRHAAGGKEYKERAIP